MATLSEEMVAARLQLDCSSAVASEITAKVVGASVNGTTDLMNTYGPFIVSQPKMGATPAGPGLCAAARCGGRWGKRTPRTEEGAGNQ